MNSAVLLLHYVTRVGKTEMLLAYLLRKIITTYGKYIYTFVFKSGKQSLPRGDRNIFKVNVHRKKSANEGEPKSCISNPGGMSRGKIHVRSRIALESWERFFIIIIIITFLLLEF